jgi:glycosyltransferase involved in cell wall biosynthesis
MKDPPFFSILTAAINSEATIRQTIESVKIQTFQSLEHIVIDGNSQDTTCDILREYENTYKLCWLSELDKGIADALNKGLSLSQGRYIIVIQADDRLLNPNILENVYLLLNKQETDLWSFPVIFSHHDKGKVLKNPIKFLWWNHFKFIFLHQGCFVHRRVFEKIGGFRNEFKIAMDYDFFYRAIAGHSSVQFGNFPVALMGGAGVGSDSKFIFKRLSEEKLVQMQNEKNPCWKTVQIIFRLLYMQYKKYRIGPAVVNKSEGD